MKLMPTKRNQKLRLVKKLKRLAKVANFKTKISKTKWAKLQVCHLMLSRTDSWINTNSSQSALRRHEKNKKLR